jgi:N-acetylmuramic acid 6-phosphate etherase
MPRPPLGAHITPERRVSDLDALATEAGGDPGADYESLSTRDLVELMYAQDASVPAAVGSAAAPLAELVDVAVERLRSGGRLVYVGAGSSGRLAAVDASECESTFSVAPGTVVALQAGGAGASPLEQEAAEDDAGAGTGDVEGIGVTASDVVVGVSASGRTPYVVGAMTAAAASGALTACIVSVPESELTRLVDRSIVVVVGPEFLAGSTRLKAGTAQKLVLNALSTISMVRLGKTYGNLMVDVAATNEKLRARVRRIVRSATGASPEQVEDALEASGGAAKVAIVTLLLDVDAARARSLLDSRGGSVRRAVQR